MSIIDKIIERKSQEDKRRDALNATAALLQIDPHARKDLITYLKAFDKARIAGDEDEQEYLVEAIEEIFEVGGTEDGPDVDEWEAQVASTREGRNAADELRDETDRFLKAYKYHKARCNLSTIRAVAEAAGLSPTTVQAIEKQSVKPQFKTIQALARAFGLKANDLGN